MIAKQLRKLICLIPLLSLQCEGEKEKEIGETIVIGTLFHSEVSPSAQMRLTAVEMAIEEINTAGILPKLLHVVNLSPIDVNKTSGPKAKEQAKKLFDDYAAVAVIAPFGNFAQEIGKLTQEPTYQDMVQCNISATDPLINLPTIDTTGTIFRMPIDNAAHGRFIPRLIVDEGWGSVGIYYADDDLGKTFKDTLLVGYPTLKLLGTFPTGTAEVSGAVKTILDTIIQEKSTAALVLGGNHVQVVPMVKYLVESGFAGAIVIPEAAKTTDIFAFGSTLAAWQTTPTNRLFATEVDNFGGLAAQTFIDKFRTTYSITEELDLYVPNAYDCAYAIALAILYANQEGDVTRTSIKKNFLKFTTEFRLPNDTAVSFGTEGYLAALAAIEAGGRVNYEGVAGSLYWDNNGDRIMQPIKVWQPTAGGVTWELHSKFQVVDQLFKKVAL